MSKAIAEAVEWGSDQLGLFNDDEDILYENEPVNLAEDEQAATANNEEEQEPAEIDLGLDEQVQLGKERKERAKIDSDRLLGKNGVIKLQAGRKRLLERLQGKGHEIQDLARIVDHYHLWAHEMFPKATFPDSLVMIERVGHLKQMRLARSGFINVYRERAFDIQQDDDLDQQDDNDDYIEHVQHEQANNNNSEISISRSEPPTESNDVDYSDDDIFDEAMRNLQHINPPLFHPDSPAEAQDKLLQSTSPEQDIFEDEMNALMETEDNAIEQNETFDEDEMQALMEAEEQIVDQNEMFDEDELRAMMDAQEEENNGISKGAEHATTSNDEEYNDTSKDKKNTK